ncbi:protein downstream neighbor of son homolog isoform X2 [Kryptolebias marmoratus]|uniref:protein downstream neighbor of son homolog isoform X2 n=1 Tax=Kryptolebias marmoratus TaxID=37003 RepID=UPI000D530FE9|nr:protein downstream neighbor of son homolog isoform X2 [Kryptolebias marmoratus]
MAQEAGYSPSFKLPTEIMRMRRKRARSDSSGSVTDKNFTESLGQSRSSSACMRPFSPGPLFKDQNYSRAGIKRRNPFATIDNTYSPQKKLFIYNENDGSVGPSKTKWTESDGYEDTKAKEQEASPCSDRSTENPQAISPSSIAPPSCTEYPADWSLKTRVLFTSPLSLSWADQPKAQEQALGLSHSCRAQFSTMPLNLQDPRSCSELRCAFQQCLVYWQHPSLSWLSLFPRINAERTFYGKSNPWAHDAELQQSLMRDWSISLSSLFSLLKSGLCPYFYVCSYQFTVLFRAAGLGGSGHINALVSPTTRGLREAMRSEGIEFSLPLVESEKKSREHLEDEEHEEKEKTCCDQEDVENNKDQGDSFLWLKEMGLQDKIRKPDGISIQLQKEAQTTSLDHKPESVVCIEGSHTFNLINFLINCKSLVAATGSQTGLPPTLLAPTAFRGATMNMLKGRTMNVKSQVGSTHQNMSTLEITGPILPSSLHAITTLLRPAQKGTFSAALYTHSPTAVLNINTSRQQRSGGLVDLTGCGLLPASIHQLEQLSTLGKTALTDINMKNYSYTWKS